MSLEFADRAQLVQRLDDAIRGRDVANLTDALRGTLCKIIRENAVEWPRAIFEPARDHYARRELHRSEELGYSVIAMTWGPGQGTLLHDHCGMWCVEGVLHGDIEIQQFELLAQDEQRYRFEARGTINAGRGSAGSLIPPHEYHTIANPNADDVAVSLHIYSGCMTTCAVFRPLGGQWFAREQRMLALD
jgi:predicted metal-dependent enzyme (double-stranded beta helix superfamily)